jgi:hypothetical protein
VLWAIQSMDPWIHSVGGRRTETQNPQQSDEPASALLDALEDLTDFGSAWANKAGGMTMPSQARTALGLPALSHWHVFGSPSLGIAVVIGPRRSAREALEFLLGAQPPGDGEQARPETAAGPNDPAQ